MYTKIHQILACQSIKLYRYADSTPRWSGSGFFALSQLFPHSVAALGAFIIAAAIVSDVASAQMQPFGFATPSRNIWCAFRGSKGGVSCDVIKHKWRVWNCSDSCCEGTRFYLPQSGRAESVCSSDSLYGYSNKILGYGQQLTQGLITCYSLKTGLLCRNESGGELFLNREDYRLK